MDVASDDGPGDANGDKFWTDVFRHPSHTSAFRGVPTLSYMVIPGMHQSHPREGASSFILGIHRVYSLGFPLNHDGRCIHVELQVHHT